MTGPEYRAIRKSCGLTQDQLAALLGVNNNTITRRERGYNPITLEAEIALRWIAECKAKKNPTPVRATA